MRKWHCAECGELLTVEEVDYWAKNTPYCCDGRECGCMGLPIYPPYCDKCMTRYERKEG